MKRVEDLKVYKKALNFSVTIYKFIFEKSFNNNIKNQIQRTTLSIPLNITEGFELQSNRQFVKFLYISKGANIEGRSLYRICEELYILEKNTVFTLINEVEDISKQLSKFINFLKNSNID